MARIVIDSKFERFVRSYGVELLAGRLQVQPSAVYHWLRGSTSPKRANARKIQKLARRRGVLLSLDEIDDHYSTKPQPARGAA